MDCSTIKSATASTPRSAVDQLLHRLVDDGHEREQDDREDGVLREGSSRWKEEAIQKEVPRTMKG